MVSIAMSRVIPHNCQPPCGCKGCLLCGCAKVSGMSCLALNLDPLQLIGLVTVDSR